jgi:MoaA/NifB/PqqE/SkfB family radical SAM enzyme
MAKRGRKMPPHPILERGRSYLSFIRRALQRKSDLKNYFRFGVLGNGIRLEASSLCQLRCPACVKTCTRSKEQFRRGIGFGFLKFSDFKALLDSNTWIRVIELSNWGEIFLNQELPAIIEYAASRQISLTAVSGVNLNSITDEVIENLVRFRFKQITVSLDGASNETYRVYRKGGDLGVVLENIKKINALKQKYGTVFPRLNWQFIVFGHNEHELPFARKMARELGMNFVVKMNAENWDPSYSPIQNREWVKGETGWDITSVKDFERIHERNRNNPCYQLWTSPQVNWDGRLLGCCLNIYSDFGNVFESGLESCLKSDRYRYTKRMLWGISEPREDSPCYRCKKFKNRFLRFK